MRALKNKECERLEMPKGYILRKATAEDCKEIYDLICELEDETFPYSKFLDMLCVQLSDKNYYCLVCEKEKKIVGVLNLRFEAQLHHADYIAEIMEFVVSPLCRHIGIGKEMLERASQIARELGCVQIDVACNQLRKDAHRFYLREGMQSCHFKFSKSLL